MACEYCRQIGTHHPRCPLYKPQKSNRHCSLCNDVIVNGERYIVNDNDEYAHFDCFDMLGTRGLLKWLGYDIKEMDDD